jgi:uncharacterized protein (DUF305 family)
MFVKITRCTTALCLVLSVPVAAQEMKGMDHSAMQGDASPSTQAFKDANAKMHQSMAIQFSGDADVDFARAMIGHHQGAIDMAKVELAHGKDPELRRLAEDIIQAQEAEIADMQAWLKVHAK